MSTVNFRRVMKDAGVPVTQRTAMDEFRRIVAEENAPFNNAVRLSPFWRLVSLLFVKPFMWLVKLLYQDIFPALFLKTATGEWVDVFAWQLGLERKAATKAKGMITLTRHNATGQLVVPLGTVIQSAPIAGRVYRLEVIDPGLFKAGDKHLDVLCEAVETGSAYNLATGFYALIATNLAGIASVSNADGWLLVPGADEETDEDLKQRCRNSFTAVNQWHIDAVYKAMLSDYPGVDVADIWIDSDAPRGAGTANAYILFDDGVPADEYIAVMTQRIMTDGNHGFSDDVLISAMPTQNLEQSAQVRFKDFKQAHEKTALIEQISSFIRVALRELPVSVGYSPTRTFPHTLFSWSLLIHELHVQFPDLLSIDFAHDADIDCRLWVPKLTSLNLTEVSA